MIYRISIILYQYNYRIEKIDRFPALVGGHDETLMWKGALTG